MECALVIALASPADAVDTIAALTAVLGLEKPGKIEMPRRFKTMSRTATSTC